MKNIKNLLKRVSVVAVICLAYRLKLIPGLICVLTIVVCNVFLEKQDRIKKQYLAKYNDVVLYMEQMIYSFKKQPKIRMALLDAQKVSSIEMREVIEEAIVNIDSNKSANIYEDALAIIEKEYNCGRIKSLHKFIIKIENYGGNYENYLCKGKKDYPYILVFLNEYSSFMENFSELETDFMNILREGTKYGIYVLTTVSTINDIRMRISSLFKQSVAMQLNDNSEYSAIFSGIRNMYPASISGRGLMKNNSVYEFQTACFTEKDEIEYLKQLCLKDKDKNKNIKNNVPYLPEKVTLQNIKSVENKNNFFVLGYSSNDISPLGIYMSRDFLFPVMAKEIGRLKPFLEEFLIVSKFYNKNVTVIDAEHLTDSADIGKHNQFEDYIVAMYQELVERNNEYADTRNKKIFDNKEEKIYVIIGFKKLYDSLNTDGKGKLEVILRYGKAMYKQHIVIAENADVFAQYDKSIWYQSQIYGQNGIWIGYGIETQKVFDVNTFRLQIKDDMSYSFGYYVHGDRLTEARFLYKEDIDDE